MPGTEWPAPKTSPNDKPNRQGPECLRYHKGHPLKATDKRTINQERPEDFGQDTINDFVSPCHAPLALSRPRPREQFYFPQAEAPRNQTLEIFYPGNKTHSIPYPFFLQLSHHLPLKRRAGRTFEFLSWLGREGESIGARYALAELAGPPDNLSVYDRRQTHLTFSRGGLARGNGWTWIASSQLGPSHLTSLKLQQSRQLQPGTGSCSPKSFQVTVPVAQRHLPSDCPGRRGDAGTTPPNATPGSVWIRVAGSWGPTLPYFFSFRRYFFLGLSPAAGSSRGS